MSDKWTETVWYSRYSIFAVGMAGFSSVKDVSTLKNRIEV